ncbi:unnamed protein product [Urochloa humidicola]
MERTLDEYVRCGESTLCRNAGDEYPCVKRFRYRRLVAMLYLQGFEATFESILDESDAVFSLPRLQKLVLRGQWRDALHYLSRFLPLEGFAERAPPLSVEGEVLHRFLAVHLALADIVAGTGESTVYSQFLNHDNRAVCHGAIRLRSIVFSIFYGRQQYRASIDWQCVRNKAADIVYDLVYRTPELKNHVYIPFRLMDLHQVLPIGFGFLRRSHARNEFRRRFHSRSRTRRRRAYALAKAYLMEQRSLPAISDPSQESYDELSVSKALDSVADLVDECLKAGKGPWFHNVCPIQTIGTEGATASPVLQTIFSSLTCPAINPGMQSVSATGGSKLASHVPTNDALSLGTMCAPVPQTMFGSLTSCYGNSGVGLMANAGDPVAHVSQTMNLNHAGSSGGIAAPVSQSQTMLGSMAHPAINLGMLSVANAGKLGSHVPTGAPFLGNMHSPVLQSMLGSLTSRYGNSSIGLVANSGPLAPAWQTMNLTNHAGSTGAPVSPAMQIMNLASHAENSGAPVAPALQTMNIAGHAENSGISKHLDKECRHVESGHKILDPSKNPREEISILDEQDLHLKSNGQVALLAKQVW